MRVIVDGEEIDSLAYWIECKLLGHWWYDEEKIDYISTRVENIESCLGFLMESLVERGLLSLDDVKSMLNLANVDLQPVPAEGEDLCQ